ncbi:SDR family NAD(P)-dependent oxidoreductase [Nocardiopsis dassonvillei]
MSAEHDGSPADKEFWEAVENGDLEGVGRELAIDDGMAHEALASVLPALAKWRTRRRVNADIDSLRYRVNWRPRPLDSASPPRLSGTWLVAVPESEDTTFEVNALQTALRESGATVVRLPIARSRRHRTDVSQRIAEVLHAAGTESSQVSGVLSLLCLNRDTDTERSVTPWHLGATVALYQGLIDAGCDGRLWVLSCGAASTTASDPVTDPEQAMLWGWGGIIAVETPNRWGGLVDLPAEPDEHCLRRLPELLAGGRGKEDEFAIRGNDVFVRRLVRCPLKGAPVGNGWTPDGTVLVTGGTGALGRHIARWAARKGAAHLLLLSRRGREAPGAAELEAELEELGAGVSFVKCDIAERSEVEAALDAIPVAHPLDAVFHTAALLDDAVAESLTTEQIERVLRVKAGGAANLHDLTRDTDLSAFVLFSSISGICGIAGQTNYAPGNAYLDALALFRRSSGLPATSVAWGHWDGGGIAAPDVEEQLRRRGALMIAPETGIAALEGVLERDESPLAICRVDWQQVRRDRPTTSLLDELPEADRTASDETAARQPDGGVPDLASVIAGLSPDEQHRTVLDLVRSEAASVQGYASLDQIDALKGFQELGFDSLSAVRFRNSLDSAVGIRLPVTLVYDYPTPAKLADYLLEGLRTTGQDTGADVFARIDLLESALSSMTEDEEINRAVSRISGMLERIGRSSESEIAEKLSGSTEDEIFTFIGEEFGIS